jgi:hypothetical protein
MPDLDQIKQEEQEARDRRGRFAKSRSGNPAAGPSAATSAARRGFDRTSKYLPSTPQ